MPEDPDLADESVCVCGHAQRFHEMEGTGSCSQCFDCGGFSEHEEEE